MNLDKMVRKKIMLRVLIVDDTALYRKILRDVLENIPGVQVVGTAYNGKIALEKIDMLQPDLVTLDVEMPEMNGLQTLEHLRLRKQKPRVIMVSSLTKKDAMVTMRALHLGAFDFITKPDGGSIASNVKELTEQFTPKIEALLRQKQASVHPSYSVTPKDQSARSYSPPTGTIKTPPRPRAVVVGISTGGPKALGEIIPRFPANFPVPIYIVQHMPPVFTRALAESLNKKSSITVVEAENNMTGQPGHVYIAPGNKQMKIIHNGPFGAIQLTDDPPENFCKPSADYLFRSAGKTFGAHVLGVIMTGMGRDGTKGLEVMKQEGAYVIAQDQETSTVFGMPMEAIKAGVVDEVLPLQQIPDKIIQIVTKN